MPALKGKNLRSGDVIEQLGLLLLQNLSLVAPIPRTEDVGIDAVVTLLEDFDSYRFIASDSFFVQIKSESVDKITYKEEQVNWLFSLELPFFIASINKFANSVNLYCCHRLSDAYITNKKRDKIIIRFNQEEDWDHFVDEDCVDIHVGPPILNWSIDDVFGKSNFREKFTKICKEHVKSAKTTLKTRRVGWVESIYWETNELPKINLFKSCCSMKPGEMIGEITDTMMPYFSMLLDETIRAKDNSWLKDLKSLLEEHIELIDLMKKNEIL